MNPRLLPRLAAAARRHAALVPSGIRQAGRDSLRVELRLPMGAIQSAVVAMLRAGEEPMRPVDVRRAVEALLGRDVSGDTVTSFLSIAARDPAQPVVRVEAGRYVAGRR